MTNDNIRTGIGDDGPGHIPSIHDHLHAGIVECRQRLRRLRATKRRDGFTDRVSDAANTEPLSYITEIDRRAPPRAICKMTGEADET